MPPERSAVADAVVIEHHPARFNGRQLDAPNRSGLPASITAAALQNKHFDPVRWVVPRYIPQGLTMLAAKPKIGKSWLMLGTAIACASGGYTLGQVCAQGDVLYAALEDGERRLKARMEIACPDREPWPTSLEFWTEMKRLELGGTDQLRAWITAANDPRLIIIDTFAKIRSPKAKEETAYEADYRQAGQLKAIADETGVAIVIVHHVRKMEADDPLDAVSGTTGLTGALDTILVMKREAANVVLYGRGRDIEEIDIAMEFQRDICRWRVLGDACEVRMSDERKQIIQAITEDGAMTPAEISAVTGRARVAVRRLVTKMAKAGDLSRPEKAKYGLP